MSIIALVAGARPNFMKIAPIVRELRKRGRTDFELVHTGQHYDEGMSDVFFRQLEMPAPDVQLGVGSGSHSEQTARILESFEKYLLHCNKTIRGVVVVGDVNSTMACALAAVKLGIPVAHVEAGLRSFDRSMPEEINRIVTDAIASLHLVSEPAGGENLRREGVPAERIRYTGNVMIDTLVHQLEAAGRLPVVAELGLEPGKFAYVTLHRPHNVDNPARLEALLSFLESTSSRLPVVFPVHPRTRARLQEFGLLDRTLTRPAVRLLGPLGYRESLALMSRSRIVITDSGGIQEETSFLGIPCITLRPGTERPATVDFGTNTVVGDDLEKTAIVVNDVLLGRAKRGTSIPGWDGCAAQRVVDALMETWG